MISIYFATFAVALMAVAGCTTLVMFAAWAVGRAVTRLWQ